MSVARVASFVVVSLLAAGCVEQPTYGPAFDVRYAPAAVGAGPAGPAAAAQAVAFAHSRIGTPYCWGGSGPRCFDCSGLTRAAWAAAGKRIPRTSSAQVSELPPVAMSEVQPGDILWRPGHVGIYAGRGWVIAATHRGDVVRYQPASTFQRAVRP